MDYRQSLLVLLAVLLRINQGLTIETTEAAHIQTPSMFSETSTEGVHTSTLRVYDSALLKMMNELNSRILGLTTAVSLLEEINSRIIQRLDEMDNKTQRRFDEIEIQVKFLELSTSNSSEIIPNKYLALSEDINKVITQLEAMKTSLEPQEIQSNKREKQFKLFTHEKKTWTEAYDDCIKNNMSLASIENDEENRKVVSLMSESDEFRDFWLSGTDLGHTGRYVWNSTGRDVTYNYWQPGEPNNEDYMNGDIEHCMEMSWRGETSWLDFLCSIRLHYICHHWV